MLPHPFKVKAFFRKKREGGGRWGGGGEGEECWFRECVSIRTLGSSSSVYVLMTLKSIPPAQSHWLLLSVWSCLATSQATGFLFRPSAFFALKFVWGVKGTQIYDYYNYWHTPKLLFIIPCFNWDIIHITKYTTMWLSVYSLCFATVATYSRIFSQRKPWIFQQSLPIAQATIEVLSVSKNLPILDLWHKWNL